MIQLDRIAEIHIKDVKSAKRLVKALENTEFEVVWMGGDPILYICEKIENKSIED